jgi:hypothetical protein
VTRNGLSNVEEREIGAQWENQFCGMARTFGKVFTPHQFGRPESAKFYGPPEFFGGKRGWTLPDITIWSAPGEHHELKHKRPTFDGCYGLERYRLDALVRFANVTGQAVYYTIHDWCMAGGGCSSELMRNDLAHWVTADIATLARGCTRKSTEKTWYNGKLVDAETWYWTADVSRKLAWFRPLADLWAAAKAA